MSAHAQTANIPKSDANKLSFEAQRYADCLIVLIALILLAPFMALTVAAIWIESGRPIFFSQIRLGKAGRPFRLHKFRKFHATEQQSGPAVTLRNDPRSTRVGRVLERTKLDELPQLWNILVGEMALVGPRPESLAFADCFDGSYRRTLDYKPGIFGPCQVIFRHESDLYEPGRDPEEFYRQTLFPLKASVELAYFPNRTMVSDARWAVQSVLAVFDCSFRPFGNMRSLEAITGWVQGFSRMAVQGNASPAMPRSPTRSDDDACSSKGLDLLSHSRRSETLCDPVSQTEAGPADRTALPA